MQLNCRRIGHAREIVRSARPERIQLGRDDGGDLVQNRRHHGRLDQRAARLSILELALFGLRDHQAPTVVVDTGIGLLELGLGLKPPHVVAHAIGERVTAAADPRHAFLGRVSVDGPAVDLEQIGQFLSRDSEALER